MRTLNVSISDNEFNKFGLKQNKFAFAELIKIIRNEIARENLNKSIELADKYNLSEITMDEITEEVKAVRSNAKNNN